MGYFNLSVKNRPRGMWRNMTYKSRFYFHIFHKKIYIYQVFIMNLEKQHWGFSFLRKFLTSRVSLNKKYHSYMFWMNYTHNGTYLGTILKRKNLEITYCIDNFNSLRYSSKCKFLYCRISNIYYQHRSLYCLKPK